jgi:hypothetical protein
MNNLVTYAIWSDSSRLVTLLEADANAALFAAGTSFLVLDVEQSTDGSGSATVFLAERRTHPAAPGSPADDGEDRILEHLRAKLATRSAQPTPGQHSAGWFDPDPRNRAHRAHRAHRPGLARRPAAPYLIIPAPARSGDDA